MHGVTIGYICQNQLGKEMAILHLLVYFFLRRVGLTLLGLFYAWERVNCRYYSYSRKFSHFCRQQIYELEDAKLTVGMGGKFAKIFTVYMILAAFALTDRQMDKCISDILYV